MNDVRTSWPGAVAGIRPELRELARVRRKTRSPRGSAQAGSGVLAVVVLSLMLNCLAPEWASLAAIGLTALGAALLLASNASAVHRAAWTTCVAMAAGAGLGVVQWTSAATADWAATETRILRAAAAALFCLSVGLVRDSRQRDRLMDALAALGGLLAGLALWQASVAEPFSWWPFPNRNHFAACCELLLPVATWRAWQSRHWQVVPAVALALAGMLSGSRAGLILIASQLLYLTWWASRPARRRVPARWLLLGATTLPLLAILLGGESAWARWRQTPLLYRDQIWAASWELVEQRPWLGHGLGSFAAVYPSVMRFDTGERVHRAHNDWLEWMVEGGVPAAVPMLVLLALTLTRLRQTPWALGIPVVLLHSAVDYPLDRFSLLLMFSLIATLALMDTVPAGSHRRTRIKPAEKPFPESEIISGPTLE